MLYLLCWDISFGCTRTQNILINRYPWRSLQSASECASHSTHYRSFRKWFCRHDYLTNRTLVPHSHCMSTVQNFHSIPHRGVASWVKLAMIYIPLNIMAHEHHSVKGNQGRDVQISDCIRFQIDMQPLFTIQFQFRIVKKPDNEIGQFYLLIISLVTHFNRNWCVQQSGCPSQTSAVPKLLSAHSNDVVDSTVTVSCGPYINIRYPINYGSGQRVTIPTQYMLKSRWLKTDGSGEAWSLTLSQKTRHLKENYIPDNKWPK